MKLNSSKLLKEIPMLLYTEFNQTFSKLKEAIDANDIAETERLTGRLAELFDEMDKHSCHSFTKDTVEKDSYQESLLSMLEFMDNENYADSLVLINKVGRNTFLSIIVEERDIVKSLIKRAYKAGYEEKQKSLEVYLEKLAKAESWIMGLNARENGWFKSIKSKNLFSKDKSFVIINVCSDLKPKGLTDSEVIEATHSQLDVDKKNHEKLKDLVHEGKFRFVDFKINLIDYYYNEGQPILNTEHEYEEPSLLIPFESQDKEKLMNLVLGIMKESNQSYAILLKQNKAFYLSDTGSVEEISEFKEFNSKIITICCDLLRVKKQNRANAFYKPISVGFCFTTAQNYLHAYALHLRGHIVPRYEF